jgi:hypothetical protein
MKPFSGEWKVEAADSYMSAPTGFASNQQTNSAPHRSRLPWSTMVNYRHALFTIPR